MMQSIWAVPVVFLWVLMLFVALTFLFPRTVTVKRRVLVEGPPGTVFPQLNEARSWLLWFPWGQQGECTDVTYEGPEAGEGATRKWEGASGATGHQVLVETDPPNYLRMSIEVGRYGHGRAEWFIEPTDDSVSRITCVLRFSPRRRWEGFFLQGQIAEEIEEGLQSLREEVESSPEARSNGMAAY